MGGLYLLFNSFDINCIEMKVLKTITSDEYITEKEVKLHP
jgi:hypothetical protein